jgi:hypothetical protein
VDRRNGLLVSLSAIGSALVFSFIIHSPWSFPSIYSDVGSFWGRAWLAGGQVPNSSPGTFFEYPPISSLILYLAGALGRGYDGYYEIFGAFSLVAGAGIAWSAWRLTRVLGRNLSPLYFILPSMLVYGIYNFDLFEGLFVLLSLQLFCEDRKDWSAVALGLAVSTKLVGGVLLPLYLLELKNPTKAARYLVVVGGVTAASYLPLAVGNFGYFSQFVSYFSNWGLEDAWYIWIFIDQYSHVAKAFGLILMIVLLVRVYTLKFPLETKAFLAVASYLFATFIYAPQFNVTLIPLVAILGLDSASLYSWEVFNVLIIFTWFTTPDPTHAWTLPQAMALIRSLSLALLFLPFMLPRVGWLKNRVQPGPLSPPNSRSQEILGLQGV